MGCGASVTTEEKETVEQEAENQTYYGDGRY